MLQSMASISLSDVNTRLGTKLTAPGNVFTGNLQIVGNATITDTFTANFLVGNGQGITGLVGGSGGLTITNIAITDANGVALDDTALGDGSYVKITGTGFGSGAVAMLGTVSATSTTGISQTELRARFVGVSAGTYSLFVINTDGSSAVLPNGVTWSDFPAWTTTSLAPVTKTRALSQSIAATGDSAITYTANNLPSGTTLTSAGVLSGNITEFSNVTTVYTFTAEATDAELQSTAKILTLSAGYLRNFSGNVIVSNATYTGDTNHLAVSNSGGFVKIMSNSSVFFSNSVAKLGTANLSTTLASSTELRAIVPAAPEGTTRALEIVNSDGSVLTGGSIAQWAPPAWTTASGQLGDAIYKGDSFSRTVAATHGAGSMTYAAISGFPAGVSVNSGGVISGSTPVGNTNEIATILMNAFSVNTLQNATREFTLSFLSGILFDFTTHTFTNAGVSGRTGPSLAQCRAAYSTTWDENSAYFNVTAGIQKWTVPRTASYRISAYGAQGIKGITGGFGAGYAMGGKGAGGTSDFNLTIGEVLHILVGQTAVNTSTTSYGATNRAYGGSGGGGSFVIRAPYTTIESIAIIAGGGGGGGLDTSTGVDGGFASSAGRDGLRAGGINGYGGTGSAAGGYGGAGGGGFLGSGGNGYFGSTVASNSGGFSFVSGGLGGVPFSSYPQETAFGGGGAAIYSAGGGGGFSGGGADENAPGSQSLIQGGGGGGSYSNQGASFTAGAQSGHGQVIITAL